MQWSDALFGRPDAVPWNDDDNFEPDHGAVVICSVMTHPSMSNRAGACKKRLTS
jgi:hypothetical protein